MIKLSRIFVIAIVTALFIPALAQEKQEKEIKHTTARHTSPSSGLEMYTSYCAVCHGKDAKGGGPAADALKVPPSDLTMLAKKNGGTFPTAHVSAVIRGEAALNAHGSKDMPVWGPVFWKMSGGHESEVMLRVTNLTKYIESLQSK